MPSDFVILTWSAISFPFDRSLGAARKYPLRSGDAACRIRSARSFKPVSPERSGSSDPGETEGGRKSLEKGKSGTVRVDLGGRGHLKNKVTHNRQVYSK